MAVITPQHNTRVDHPAQRGLVPGFFETGFPGHAQVIANAMALLITAT